MLCDNVETDVQRVIEPEFGIESISINMNQCKVDLIYTERSKGTSLTKQLFGG